MNPDVIKNKFCLNVLGISPLVFALKVQLKISMEHLWNITGRTVQIKCTVHRNPVSTLTGTVLLFITKTNQLLVFRGMIGAFYESYTQHTNTSFIKFQRFLKTELGC